MCVYIYIYIYIHVYMQTYTYTCTWHHHVSRYVYLDVQYTRNILWSQFLTF